MSKEKAIAFIKSLTSRDIVEFYWATDMYMVSDEYALTWNGIEIWAIQLTDDECILISTDWKRCGHYSYDKFKKEEYRCMQTIEL